MLSLAAVSSGTSNTTMQMVLEQITWLPLFIGAAVAGLEIGTRTGPVPVCGVVGLVISVINFLLIKYYYDYRF